MPTLRFARGSLENKDKGRAWKIQNGGFWEVEETLATVASNVRSARELVLSSIGGLVQKKLDSSLIPTHRGTSPRDRENYPGGKCVTGVYDGKKTLTTNHAS